LPLVLPLETAKRATNKNIRNVIKRSFWSFWWLLVMEVSEVIGVPQVTMGFNTIILKWSNFGSFGVPL
jgi:hypothetical protein